MSQPRRPRRPPTTTQPDSLPALFPHSAGIDLGATSHFVSVPEGRDPQPVREFNCFTPDLRALAAWLHECDIEQVVMESTGVYWVPLYRILEDQGFDVKLVDARQAKHLPGRKSDVQDCVWLRQLNTFGLLRGCFVPPSQVVELREYWRLREDLVRDASRQLLLMQKALDQMNLHLHKVLSDLSGVTGMLLLRAIAAGETDPLKLASIEHPRVKASEAELLAALTGDYRPEQLFCLRSALAAWDFYQQRIADTDAQVEACLARFATHPERATPVVKRSQTRRKNQPHFDLRAELARICGVDLTRIDGIEVLTAQTILSELGPDLSAFATAKQFSSWLGLCPNHQITGGRVRRRRTRRVANRVSQALRLAAQSLHHSDSELGAFYRRMLGRKGAPKAITATAHKLAERVWLLMTKGEAYVDAGAEAAEARYREAQHKSLCKRAANLGLKLFDPATGVVVS
jgi:transposase